MRLSVALHTGEEGPERSWGEGVRGLVGLNDTGRNKVNERKQDTKKKNISIKERRRIVGGDGGVWGVTSLRRSTLVFLQKTRPCLPAS